MKKMRILLRVLTVAMVILLNMLFLRKKTKKELANSQLSWFEENTKEREEFTKENLGIDTIANKLRKTAKK